MPATPTAAAAALNHHGNTSRPLAPNDKESNPLVAHSSKPIRSIQPPVACSSPHPARTIYLISTLDDTIS